MAVSLARKGERAGECAHLLAIRRCGAIRVLMTEALRAWLLGGFRVAVGSRVIEEDAWRLRKAAGLIKMLALTAGHQLHHAQGANSLR
jgi:hypothetical protein